MFIFSRGNFQTVPLYFRRRCPFRRNLFSLFLRSTSGRRLRPFSRLSLPPFLLFSSCSFCWECLLFLLCLPVFAVFIARLVNVRFNYAAVSRVVSVGSAARATYYLHIHTLLLLLKCINFLADRGEFCSLIFLWLDC